MTRTFRPARIKAAVALVLMLALSYVVSASTRADAMLISLKTFPVSIDVDLKLTERSIWRGIRPGCYAPQEDFDQTYRLNFDSRPSGKKSTIKNGTASLTPASFGVTPSYGDKHGVRQYSNGGTWDLEIQNPADCNTDTPPPPAWAVAPTCKKISERVEATLTQSTIDDPDNPNGLIKSGDGVLIITRTPKARPTIHGASIGDSCYRTLHDVTPSERDSLVAITTTDTLISVPIPDAGDKMAKLSKGKRKSNPAFKVKIEVGGDCKGMWMRPRTGERSDYMPSPFSQPHNALGAFDGDGTRSICSISGSGTATFRREGLVVDTNTLLK
ncbi:MAG: hypothetical protein HY827_06015 [Actinobacteria bacterium]|nr:hypothetical protein [Actinomycetota bacterium]